MSEEEYEIYIKPLYENWSVKQAKENIRKAQEENENILEEITKRIISVEQQLQSYEDKEDKLRDIFEDESLKKLNKYYYGDGYELEAHELREDILAILNEGSDE